MTARLPIPGSDDDTWGEILNDFLLVAHNGDGTLQTAALTAAGGEVTSNKGIANGYAALNGSSLVPTAQLATGTATSSNFLRGDGTWAVPAGGGGSPGGSPNQLQYNQAGVFGGITGATTDGTALTVASGDFKLAGGTSGTTLLNASATASGTLTLPAATDTLVGKATTDTFTNKTFDTAGSGNAFAINSTAISAVTGSGAVVLASSPSLATPTLGAASVTTVNKVTITAPAASATLTIANGKTLTVNNSLAFSGTDSTTMTFPGSSDTVVTLGATQALSNKDLTSGTNSFPTLNQNTTGSAAKWTTARLLAGNSVDGSADVTFANKFIVQGTTDSGLSAAQFLGALGTGLLKNTTTTGVLSIASSGTDYAPATSGTSILKGNGTGGFSTATADTDYTTPTGTETLTNKRINKRTGTVASSATPTINTDNIDFYSIMALAADITSFTTNLSGTPVEAQTLWIAITDNGTPRALSFGSSFEASTVALPTTTVTSTRLDIGFVWNTVTSKWRCIAVA